MFDPHADGTRILVVLPALNEARSVGSVVRDVRDRCPDYDVLVVDDGSTDETAKRASEAGAMVCSLPFNLGVGGAMRAAYKFALRHGYDVVVQVDADGQHDPAYIHKLVDGLADVDLVVGARFAGIGEYRAAFARRLAMRLLASVLSRLADVRLTDVTSGFRAAGPRCIELFALHYPAEYLGDTVESLVIALRTGCSIDQMPVEMRTRSYGAPSQSAFRATLYLARAVAALSLALVRQWPVPEEIRDAELPESQGHHE
ncbi:glycosyltransferase family 2 protein [Nocardioides iriomotensis]|uniref:glycosyltransferase family 2 protein n=1 Tax=Nocardioides iriomotensis TaxID=715784 RepID=UPI001F0D32A0|nr:glycosyltransferase family 2 protein [Nocardioides iriomotensis]